MDVYDIVLSILDNKCQLQGVCVVGSSHLGTGEMAQSVEVKRVKEVDVHLLEYFTVSVLLQVLESRCLNVQGPLLQYVLHRQKLLYISSLEQVFHNSILCIGSCKSIYCTSVHIFYCSPTFDLYSHNLLVTVNIVSCYLLFIFIVKCSPLKQFTVLEVYTTFAL